MSQPDEDKFENTIKSLEATTTSIGVHLEVDSTARRLLAHLQSVPRLKAKA